MSDDRLIKMLYLLKERTENKKISWEETVNENIYQSAFPKYTIQIGYYSNTDSFSKRVDYFIRILDEDNKVIEDAKDDDLKGELDNPFEIMESLYRSARRQAMGVDKALDNILSELENNN
jgi:hypothetical protein